MKLGSRIFHLALAASVLSGCSALDLGAKRAFGLQAHRGGRALAPEKTLAALSDALGMGGEPTRSTSISGSRPTAWW